MINNKVLYQPWGGLGDNLQYSTLPRRFAELGIDFFISNKNTYRNREIYELVWGLNPYVKGISSENFNSGDITFNIVDTNKSIIYNQEYSHGLEPINEIPEIYYKPNYIDIVKDIILVDWNSISLRHGVPVNLKEYINYVYPNKKIIIPSFNTKLANSVFKADIEYDDIIEIKSIFHYCDLIHSCYHFICTFSGQSVLASSLNKKETTCFMEERFKYNNYQFPNINYQII